MANMKDIKKNWIEENKEWIEANKNDKIKVNMAYTLFLDGLCRDGYITLSQWQKASTRIIK